jgi:L-serine dehydratase
VDAAAATLAPALMGFAQTDAVARAMAVLERSAAMGVIVAAPTAGASGVVPGCVLACADALGANDDAAAAALWCAAAVGLNIQTSASVAGAEGGCQAEVGSAAAMAAAALVELMGGTPAEALTASSLALSNLLGLVCDPVGGLVEVPCQARNAIGVAAAFSSAQLALSGVGSLVPFDEVVRTMAEVGHAMPASLRETARGGLAVAPSARAACAACGACG